MPAWFLPSFPMELEMNDAIKTLPHPPDKASNEGYTVLAEAKMLGVQNRFRRAGNGAASKALQSAIWAFFKLGG